MSDRLRVAIIDDHPLFREGVVHTLRGARVLDVVGEGGTADDAVRTPGVARHRSRMPGGDRGGTLDRAVLPDRQDHHAHRFESEQDVAQALEAGVKGDVLKGTSGSELLKTMFAIARGESYVTPGLAARLLTQGRRQEPAQAAPPHPELTQREGQILAQVARGHTNKEIARALSLSEKTVKHHMTNVMQKLQVRNRVEAAMVFRKQTQRR
jgi:DNA-binding NarL/FixJ family response regulator